MCLIWNAWLSDHIISHRDTEEIAVWLMTTISTKLSSCSEAVSNYTTTCRFSGQELNGLNDCKQKCFKPKPRHRCGFYFLLLFYFWYLQKMRWHLTKSFTPQSLCCPIGVRVNSACCSCVCWNVTVYLQIPSPLVSHLMHHPFITNQSHSSHLSTWLPFC